MSRKTVPTGILTAALLVAAVPAPAAVLATQPAFVSNAQSVFCRIVNVSSKDQPVTIQIIDNSGTILHGTDVTLLPGRATSISWLDPVSSA